MDMSGGHEGMAMAPNSSSSTDGTMMTGHKMHGMMHMTFYWGNDALILFDQWPAGNSGMYALALIIVFFMSVFIEFLSNTRIIKPGSNSFVAGLVQTLLHVLRVGLAYLVMLALMSFNGGVFLVAVLGHAIGFFFCGSDFRKQHHDEPHDNPTMSC